MSSIKELWEKSKETFETKSVQLVLLVIMLLEKERGGNEDEKYMMILTLIVLGFSMGARNLVAMVFGV